VLAEICGDDVRKLAGQELANVKLESSFVSVIRATHTAEDGLDCLIHANDAPALHNALKQAGAISIDDAIAETLRIEAGIPRYGVDMDETTIVTETNLDDAVSFTKGCYLGQEIIIRIKHRGHVAKKLSGILFDSAATVPAETKLLSEDGKEIGRVTSTTFSPRLDRIIALGYVKYDHLTPGTRVNVSLDGVAANGVVAELPMVRGSWYEN
jgi:folate-binding protein YgfZ